MINELNNLDEDELDIFHKNSNDIIKIVLNYMNNLSKKSEFNSVELRESIVRHYNDKFKEHIKTTVINPISSSLDTDMVSKLLLNIVIEFMTTQSIFYIDKYNETTEMILESNKLEPVDEYDEKLIQIKKDRFGYYFLFIDTDYYCDTGFNDKLLSELTNKVGKDGLNLVKDILLLQYYFKQNNGNRIKSKYKELGENSEVLYYIVQILKVLGGN